jgi:lipopolysaccharide export system permease protein
MFHSFRQLSLTDPAPVRTIHRMYILTRYVVWEVMKFFVAALVVLTLIFTVGFGVREGIGRGAPPMVMLRVMPYLLPQMLGITLPVAMLYAVSSVFGRMTGANEIVALKSLGISPMAAVWPAVVLAAFLSLGTVCMYEIDATTCRMEWQQVFLDSIEEVAYSVLQKDQRFSDPNYPISVTVTRVEGRKLIKPTITIKGPPPATLTAAEAELHFDPKTRKLRIIYTDSELEVDGVRCFDAGTQQYEVPIPIPPPPKFHRDYVAMRDIPDLIHERQGDIRELEAFFAANKALGQPESPQDLIKINYWQTEIFRLRTEPYRRWANGFSCLCFALIGTPVAMLRRHADALTNFFFCFLPILVVYYPLLMFGEDLTTTGRLWPICFWMANAILFIPAVILLRRVIRH